MITFDGLYATLTVMVCNMEDAGIYKVVFENQQGKDESSGKLVVKPVRNLQIIYLYSIHCTQ
jgi:hypothetical protein